MGKILLFHKEDPLSMKGDVLCEGEGVEGQHITY